jgi:hypothetical protein
VALYIEEVMSLSANSAGAKEVAGTSAVVVPLLTPGMYAAWRPLMENALMRSGIAVRDYAVHNADWVALVSAVDRWSQDEEDEGVAYALGRTSMSSQGASSTASGTAGPSTAEKESRRRVSELVARTRRAYALLYQALPGELRRLVTQVPQGDANGLWTWLEQRYQNTEQDNIGDLWDKFTALLQDGEELFEEYKARVDHVYGLLDHAKDKPSAGLYAHRVLWKLTSRYAPAVLALKASGKLKDAAKIDWVEIVAFINNHERSEQRMNKDNADEQAMMAGTRGDRRVRFGGMAAVECYKCGGKGHIARFCEKTRRARGYDGERGRDNGNDDGRPDDSGGGGASSSGNKPRSANTAMSAVTPQTAIKRGGPPGSRGGTEDDFFFGVTY